jgi:hypothetical protein
MIRPRLISAVVAIFKAFLLMISELLFHWPCPFPDRAAKIGKCKNVSNDYAE